MTININRMFMQVHPTLHEPHFRFEAFQVVLVVTCLPKQETQVQSLGQEDPLEEGIATHYRILARRIP